MQAKPSERPSEQDKTNQRALLSLALFEFPQHLSIPRLAVEIAAGDPLELAITELITVGLLHREGSVVLPTIAARHFDWLELS
jgi:hypothetical protein